ncbi:AraC family transcriptional regulator [Maribacter caenipelagi]|uniref:AraC family transcriptional regulator n=1 Tax=Maribacter caenipelagi TaxID=1447781 RepID=A0A4R7D1B7_9FLAO|nr:helix-turn-helix domain-containing protein [Maribacter caenipelagi]TDS12566.1 AraC family transcriptional regulator [Maribacter caenipelagi]
METIHDLIEQIPIRHNLTSTIMLLGVAQNLFLSFVLFMKSKDNKFLLYFAFLILSGAFIFLDTYLCYTGLIKYALEWNDSSEVFVLLIGPLLYFSIYCFLKRKLVSLKTGWWHFILPIGYLLSQIPFYTAPISVKLNAYLGAYYRNLGTTLVPDTFNYSYHHIKDIFDWLILFSLLLYTLLSLKLVKDERNRNTESKKTYQSSKYIFTRNSAIILSLFFILLFVVFYLYDDDGGDHYIAIFQTMVAFATSYIIISKSKFFEKSWAADKYETLGSSQHELTFHEIETFVNNNDYFIKKEASLKDLANQLKIHPNQISKTINSDFGSNFSHYINSKRVNLAKKRLIDPHFSHLTIEAIGDTVGFKSKSSFYNAFKQIANISPSQFAKSISPKL